MISSGRSPRQIRHVDTEDQVRFLRKGKVKGRGGNEKGMLGLWVSEYTTNSKTKRKWRGLGLAQREDVKRT